MGIECHPDKLEALAKHEEFVQELPTLHQFIDCANNGSSRYACFQDGFDVCNKCAEEVMLPKPPRTASTLNQTASSTSNGSSKQLNGGWFDVQLKTISHHVQEKDNASTICNGGQVIVVQNENNTAVDNGN